MVSDYERVAVVTGGSGGIGEATAWHLARCGYAVAVAATTAERAERVADAIEAAGHRAIGVGVDVGNEEDAKRLVKDVVGAFGRIDVLDNNAAATRLGPHDGEITSVSFEVWEQTLRANVIGAAMMSKHVIPIMIAAGGGSIVNISSVLGLAGESNLTAYGASKAALIQLTRSIATQWGKSGVRCNAVVPGLVLTQAARENMSDDRYELYRAHTLTPELGTPDDIARVVAFLADPASRFITGSVFTIDGGLLAHSPTALVDR